MIENEELYNIFFENEGTSMTVNCFKGSEMSVILRYGGKRIIYSMTVWEAKELVKFIKEHIEKQLEK